MLQVSSGLTATPWQGHATPTARSVTSAPSSTALPSPTRPATYRIVTNNFLSDGGDNFPAFKAGTDKYIGGLDIDGFAAYLHGSLAVHPARP